MPPDDATRVRHMIEAAKAAQFIVNGRSRGDLETDLQLRLALERAIEILGEAASGVSQEARLEHPGIPWRDIVAMRNRLSHAYFDINRDFVWKTAVEEIPALLGKLIGLQA
jgi:uncharacterized protein with HEPN domain